MKIKIKGVLVIISLMIVFFGLASNAYSECGGWDECEGCIEVYAQGTYTGWPLTLKDTSDDQWLIYWHGDDGRKELSYTDPGSKIHISIAKGFFTCTTRGGRIFVKGTLHNGRCRVSSTFVESESGDEWLRDAVILGYSPGTHEGDEGYWKSYHIESDIGVEKLTLYYDEYGKVTADVEGNQLNPTPYHYQSGWTRFGTQVTRTAPAIPGYVCLGWKDATGSIRDQRGRTGSATSVTFTLEDFDSTITWTYELSSVDVSIDGLPAQFQVSSNFNPPPGHNEFQYGGAVDLSAAKLIKDVRNKCYYRLKEFFGTGSVPVNELILYTQPLNIGDMYTNAIDITQHSSIEWVYEKVYELNVTLSGAAEGEAEPEITDPYLIDELMPYDAPRYYPDNTSVKLTSALEVGTEPNKSRCTGSSIKTGTTLGRALWDEDDRKALSFLVTANTHIEWIYVQAPKMFIGGVLEPPEGIDLPEDWDYQTHITMIYGHPSDTSGNSFFWDGLNQELYIVRLLPYFEIDWGDGPITRGYTDWPSEDQRSVITAPINLQPPGALNTFMELAYSESYTDDEGTFQPSPEMTEENPTDVPRIFKPEKTGMSIIRFSDDQENPCFRIVKAVELEDPNEPMKEIPWTIGTMITDPNHNDPEGKPGFVYFENTYYDGSGQDKAYDRENRDGQIIPVNASPQDLDSDRRMVVVWYRTDENGIAWAVEPILYDCQWPNPVSKIIIAGQNGYGPLTEYEAEGKIYVQQDREAPGFNPNEEHAMILNVSGGFRIYALRNDLNNANNEVTSEPYVLLKYMDPDTGLWQMRAFKVEATGFDEEGTFHDFQYPITAGDLISPMMPMDILPKPVESVIKMDLNGRGVGEEWYHRDHKDGHWAKAAASAPDNARIVMHWYYPLQVGFYYPFKKKDGTPLNEGEPVPFLNGGTNHEDPPEDVTYTVSWPSELPVLRIGETLTDAKYGLPDLVNMAAVRVIFDENVYNGRGPLAKLFDPLTERSIDMDQLPGDIRTESIGGNKRFPDLPYFIRSRLFYDPLNKKLIFKGISYDPGIGEPLVLLNVMTLREKEILEGFNSNWAAKIGQLFDRTRNPNGIGLRGNIQNPYDPDLSHMPGDWRDLWGIMLGLEKEDSVIVPQKLVGLPMALTAGMAEGQGYVVLTENDDESLGTAPVKLHIIRVEGGPYQGEVKVIKSDNVFDERLTLRHTGDFGGEPEKLYFRWYYQPDNSGLPPHLPVDPTDTEGWVLLESGPGLIDTTIEGPGKLTLSDNWVMVHYYYADQPGNKLGVTYPSLVTGTEDPLGPTYWSKWAGAPGGQTAQLAEGWIKRVVSDLNPLDARVKDFRNYATSMDVSMVSQLGSRYEGDIALNASPDNLNNLGLIEAYQTVLEFGKDFSINATPPIDYGPVNNALLNAGTRIADFYTLLGNEAYADALNPTIGFDSSSGELGFMASSIFAFQNQLDSLLEEELVLLRGRDDTFSTIRARPIYNRLIWNLTNGDGELAYVQTYNLFDQDESGIIDELDAKKMYPQGHGDAWGHYLTAMKVWYDLLRHDHYTWEPRVESVLVGGAPVPVDYLDERKFIQTAAAKAKVGAEIVDLTYRQSYVDDPAGQWQGYKDTDTERSWGIDGWARRTGQGAYFDWVVANAMLPAEDPVETHTGITKIDRTTVPELMTLSSQYKVIQAKVDQADQGMNPLGLAKGVVPFDINPTFLEVGSGSQDITHFEQIYERAISTLENARTVFDYANQYTLLLRSNEDDLNSFKREIKEQEMDYWNRLIEIFGYPYYGDIGPGGTYVAGYEGPDWIHFMYMDLPNLTGEDFYDDQVAYTASFVFVEDEFDDVLGLNHKSVHQEEGPSGTMVDITYHLNPDTPWMQMPPGWGKRKAPGQIQMALSEIIKAHADYERGLTELDGILGDIQASADILEAKHGVLLDQIEIKSDTNYTLLGFDALSTVLLTVRLILEHVSSLTSSTSDAVVEALPKMLGFSNDATSPGRGGIKGTSGFIVNSLIFLANAVTVGEKATEVAKEQTALWGEHDLFVDDARFEVQQMVKELETIESNARAKIQELYMLREVISQCMGGYLAVLAEGERLLSEREAFRKRTAANIQDYRYQDLGFRTFRNDAVQKYRATFDLAARYAYLAATAYDYETNLLRSDTASGESFLTDIVRQRAPGVIMDGVPVVGKHGLADPLARISQNFMVYKGQLGINNPQLEANRFSLRRELFRFRENSDESWRAELDNYIVPDLSEFSSFKRFCRPFVPEDMGPQPGIVIPFSTEVTFGYNFFGWPLGGRDSSYDPSHFMTKIRSVGVWFTNYDTTGLSNTPRVYLVPVGSDVLRSPSANDFSLREWHVVDQKLPVPFPVMDSELAAADWIPMNDSLSEEFGTIRRFSSFRAYPDWDDAGDCEVIEEQTIMDTRLVGRSVWNTQWLLIIPGGTLLHDPVGGLDSFISNVTDIKLYFDTYAYSGN